MNARKQPLLLCVLCGAVHVDWRWPLSWLHSVMMVLSTSLLRVGGACPSHPAFTRSSPPLELGSPTKYCTYICRVQSCVWHLPKYWPPPPPLHPASVSSPPTKGGGWGVHTRRAVRGWGVNILEDARHWIGPLQYNLSTGRPLHPLPSKTGDM
jgi:hypothetical protein